MVLTYIKQTVGTNKHNGSVKEQMYIADNINEHMIVWLSTFMVCIFLSGSRRCNKTFKISVLYSMISVTNQIVYFIKTILSDVKINWYNL